MKSRLLLFVVATACSGGGGGSPGKASVPGIPQVTLVAPAGNVPLEGNTVLAADARDDGRVTSVQFRLDGADLGSPIRMPPYRRSFDTALIADGAHTFEAVATDDTGHEGMASVQVQVRNDDSEPEVDFATFLGGNDHDTIRDVFVDPLGYVYVVGGTASPDLTTTSGVLDRTFNGTHDAFVACFKPGGGSLVFSTYLGGPNYDRAYAVEVDDQGYVYVAGRAGSGFPTTAGSYQPRFGGDDNPSSLYGPQDAFVAKLKPDGSALVWATYFGDDSGYALRDFDVDASGNVYLATQCDRPHFAVTSGSFDTTFAGPTEGLVAAIAADGKSLLWGSYFGGSGPDGGTPSIRVADDGTAWVLGHTQSDDFATTGGACQKSYGGMVDLVVMRIAPGGSRLEWATYFGGQEDDFTETHGLVVDDDEVVTIAATTTSTDLPQAKGPIAPPFQPSYGGSGGSGTGGNTNYPGDGFVARIAADGKSLLAFSYFGGDGGEGVEGVAIDDAGHVVFSGATYSSNLVTTADAVQRTKGQGSDAFMARFSADLTTLEFATYFGGDSDDLGRSVALEADGTAIEVGSTWSSDFPATTGAFDPTFDGGPYDGFVFEVIR